MTMSAPTLQGYFSEPAKQLSEHGGSSQQRTDERSQQIVDRGISVQSSFNTICAVEYLKSHNVNPEVIERVLLRPDLRRQGF
jgi:hypothetical protein